MSVGIFLACNTAQKAQQTSDPINHSTSQPVNQQASQAVNQQASEAIKPPAKPAPFVTWDKKMVDLGMVKRGDKRTLFFEMTNTSAEEVQIEIVDACECTKVEFPRAPIAPGSKGRFDVIFDSTEKEGPETIGINVVFKQTDAAGNPRIETVEYKFDLEK